MEITIDIPDQVVECLGCPPEALPRRVLQAVLVDACARGQVSRGKVAELLDLTFHEVESLFRESGVPYPAKTEADDTLINAIRRRPS